MLWQVKPRARARARVSCELSSACCCSSDSVSHGSQRVQQHSSLPVQPAAWPGPAAEWLAGWLPRWSRSCRHPLPCVPLRAQRLHISPRVRLHLRGSLDGLRLLNADSMQALDGRCSCAVQLHAFLVLSSCSSELAHCRSACKRLSVRLLASTDAAESSSGCCSTALCVVALCSARNFLARSRMLLAAVTCSERALRTLVKAADVLTSCQEQAVSRLSRKLADELDQSTQSSSPGSAWR